MNRITIRLSLAAAVIAVATGSDWLQFRGTDNASVSDQKDLPKTFGDGENGDENVVWKVSLPGRGPSSPIVIGGRVVVTCATGPNQNRLRVLAMDTQTGRLDWERQLWATGHTVCNAYGGVAVPTPASDGRRIFVFYSSNDLACFDLEGNLKWCRGLAYDYPTARNDVGMGSSPLVIGPTVIVQMENQGESFVAGLDVDSGETRWRLERGHDAIWASPTVLRGKTPGDDLVLLQSRQHLTAHDPETGALVWDYEAWCHTIASATTCGDRVYLPANGLHALEYDRESRQVKPLWYQQRLRGNNSSPVVHEGRAYRIKSPAILVCADTADGQILWQLRLAGQVWATPVVADGHLYAVNHDGLVQVVRLGEKGVLAGKSQIDGGILASPAVADGAIYFRSNAHLWKVAFGDRRD